MSGPNGDGDPYACFDGDFDTEISNDVAPALPSGSRDPGCGVLAFHAGTELALLTHVQNHLSSFEQQTPDSVLQTIDGFSLERHWMMHCGPEKATILKEFVKQCVDRRAPKNRSLFTTVELGTYCGYSSIMLGQTLQHMDGLSNFHIYTVEVNPQHATVAERLIQLARLDQRITILRLDMQEKDSRLVDLLKSHLGENKIDFLFLDHDKDAYLADLLRLERAGLICSGTHVAADNVVFARIMEYRNHIKALADRGIVETKLVESRLEYSEPDANASNEAKLLDGIGEYDTSGLCLNLAARPPF